MIGRALGHYRVLEKIGEGGMGTVYLAHDTRLERKVALKFLPPRLQQNETARQRLLREAKSAAAIDHPFICKIYEACEVDGDDFIAMEYVDGQTLESRMKAGPLSLAETLEIAAETAQALERAHNQQIVHRDLKPANIMLTPDGHVKVMDFGLAKRVSREADSQMATEQDLTGVGSVVGTVPYMSPEQVRGEEVDIRSDLFSFGVIVYEMAAACHPFRKGKAIETAGAILNLPHEPVSSHRDNVPADLEQAIDSMLEKDRDKRCQSATEVGSVFRQLLLATGDQTAGISVSRRVWLLAALGVAALVATAAVLTPFDWQSQPVTPDRPRIAVLPFTSLSGTDQDDKHSDGLTVGLTTHLGKLRNLAVISSTSAMLLKGTSLTMREIGEQLGVDFVVVGSFLRAGDRCSTNVELIRVLDDTHVWADEFARPWRDILSLRNDISTQIVASIAGALGSDKDVLLEIPTRNVAAYEALVEAQYLVREYRNFQREEDARSAEKFLQEALRLDPDYVDARVELAKLYWYEKTSGGVDRVDDARQAALQVLAQDNCNGDAAAVAAGVYRWDLSPNRDAELGLARRAVQCDPNGPLAHQVLNTVYFRRGFYEAALEEVDQWMQRDPLVVQPLQAAAHHWRFVGELDRALEYANEARSRVPRSPFTHLAIGEVLFFQDALNEAEASFHAGQRYASAGNAPLFEVAFAAIAAKRGNPESGRRVGRRHRETPVIAGSWSHLYQYMCILAGQYDLALDRIEADTHTNYRVLVTDSTLARLRDEPRFQALLQQQWTRWEADLASVLPSLPESLQPPELPAPEVFLSSGR